MSARHTLAAGLLLLGTLGSGACFKPTELMLQVDSDFVVPDEMDGVRVRIFASKGAQLVQEYTVRDPNADPPEDPPKNLTTLPILMGITPRDGNEVFDVQVSATKDRMSILQQTWRTKFKSHTPLLLPAYLSADCLGVECGNGETCLQGGCVNNTLEPSQLGTYEEP